MKIVIVTFLIYNAALAAKSLSWQQRIVGGQVITEEQTIGHTPYLAQFLIAGVFTCAATLITEIQLLTVAHCVTTLIENQNTNVPVSILIGSPKLYHETHYPVHKISHHAEFFKNKHSILYYNDIAVIHLKFPVEITDKIYPIRLPKSTRRIVPFTPVVISGFGGHFQSQEPSKNLSKILLTLAPLDKCQQRFPFDILSNEQICTMSVTGFGCSIGDVGSPMVNERETVILGIVSLGIWGCNTGYPDVYTKVSAYIKYIDGQIITGARDKIVQDRFIIYSR